MDVSIGLHNGYYVGDYLEEGLSNSSGEDFVMDMDDYCDMVYANDVKKFTNQINFKESKKEIHSFSSSDTETLGKELYKKLEEEFNKKLFAVKSHHEERIIRKKYICETCDDYFYSSKESTSFKNTLILTNKTASIELTNRDDFNESCGNMDKPFPFVLPLVNKKVISVDYNKFDPLTNIENSESSYSSSNYKIKSFRRQTVVINEKFNVINLRIDTVFSNDFPEKINYKLIKYFNEFFPEKENVNGVTKKNATRKSKIDLTFVEQILKLTEIRAQLK
ncbi:MAG: hypothetical protein H0U27_04480, partial [Nitrosopumilus sp.]|nr:hypothetical protein [Nitrosopumilus sp.]